MWHPPSYTWVLLWFTSIALIYEVYPNRLQGHWIVITPFLMFVGVLALRWWWALPPAVTMCVAIVLSVFSGGWSLIGLGGLPLNRLLVAIALLQVFLRAPGTASLPRVRIRNVHLLMAVTVIYALASAAIAGTLIAEQSFFLLFDVLGIAPFLLFLVSPSVFPGQRERNLLLATLVGLGAYLGLTTIFESLGPHSLVFPSYIANSDALRPGTMRPGGPFQSPVDAGFAAFACAVAAGMAFVQWRGERKRYLALLVAATCIFACFLTLERGVWLATVVAIGTTAFCTKAGRRWLVLGLIACTITIGGALVIFPALSQRASTRATTQSSVWDRQNMTSAGLRMVDAKPLFGFGWDRYTSDNLEYFRQPSDYPMTGYTPGEIIGVPANVQPLHNTYLAYAVELGLIGFLLWLGSFVWAVGGAIVSGGSRALRSWQLGLLTIAVFFLVVSFVNPHQFPFPAVLLSIWAGVAWNNASPTNIRPSRLVPVQLDDGIASAQT